MIYFIVSLLLWFLRIFSNAPFIDSMAFVIGLYISTSIMSLAIIDKFTGVFRRIVDTSGFASFFFLMVALIGFATPSFWWNLIGVIILVVLFFKSKSAGKTIVKNSLRKRLKKWLEEDENEKEGEVNKE